MNSRNGLFPDFFKLKQALAKQAVQQVHARSLGYPQEASPDVSSRYHEQERHIEHTRQAYAQIIRCQEKQRYHQYLYNHKYNQISHAFNLLSVK